MRNCRTSFSALQQVLCLLLIATTSALAANTIKVPADQPTIQAGINAASTGDTVLVAPGTYYENIDFKGKAITVSSSGGAAQTIIDGSQGGPVVRFVNNETRASIISNFTLRNGSVSTGNGSTAGVFIGDSAPTVLNNLITSNTCNGIAAEFASPLIEGNIISNTVSITVPGLACGVVAAAGVLLEGIYYRQGGISGLYPTVIGNTIESNRVGGGIMIWAADRSIIENNIIRNNAATDDGGAIVLYNSDQITIIQNLIYGNSSGRSAGAISLHPPGQSIGPFIGILANNTIAGNTTSTTGNETASQVRLEGNLGQYVLVNNVIYGASASPAMVCGTSYNYLSLTPLVFDHNDIYNAQGPAYGGACPDQTGTYSNISADPLFVDSAADDYHLRSGSPAIDAGNNSVLTLLPAGNTPRANDISSNNPRLQDATGKGYPIIDMGAYEFTGPQDANATTLALTPSAYEVTGGSTLTLTAKLISVNGIPTGSVTFFEDNQQIGASVIDSSGTATFPASALVPGIHAFTATYSGQGSFTPAVSVKFFIIVDKYPVTLKLTSSPNPSLINQSVTLTATISSPDGTVLTPITLTDGNTTLATLNPDPNGIATYTTSPLTVGTHSIQATYAGDATHSGATAYVNQQVVNGYPTPTTLTSSLNPATIGQSVTFTTTTTFGNYGDNVPAAGTMTFSDGNTVLSVQPITAQSNTTATTAFTTSSLTIGTHAISAVLYAPNGFASAATLNQVVKGLPTTTILAAATPNPAYALQPVTLSATVTTNLSTAATGTLTFYDGATPLGTAQLDPTGHATYIATTLVGGTRILHAVYNGDATFATSTSNTFTETVLLNPTSTILTITPSPSAALQAVTVTAQVSPLTNAPYSSQLCLCTVTVSINGLPPNVSPTYTLPVHNGIATFNFGLGFSAGAYTFTATFNGSPAFAASNSAPVQQIVVPAPTAITLTASPNPVTQHQAVNLTAAITAPVSATVSPGVITFFDGATPIASAPFGSTGPIPVSQLSNTATATISTSTLSAGTHLITASYAGSANFLPAVSTPLTLNVNPQDYALTTPNPSITIKTEHHLTTKVTLTSIGAFADQVALACTNLPLHATCTFDKNSLQLLPNGTATTNLTIDTDVVRGYASNHYPNQTPITLALLLPAGILGLAATRRRRLPLRLALFLLATLTTTLALSGCSGMYPASTPPGTYTVNITGNAATTGLAHTTPITLTVTP